MEKGKSSYPPRIEKQLSERGYFKLSTPERVASSNKCLQRLKSISKPSYEGAIDTLRIVRGDIIE